MVHRLMVSDGTPEDPATRKDLANFATGGVTFAHFDVHTAS